MLLRGREGSELALAVVGYRFPDEELDPWDSNTLLVSLRVVSPAGTWEVVDPCLTTWEAAHLVAWLAAAAARDPRLGPTWLLEPNLELVADPRPGDPGRVRLRVRVQLELRPPWAVSAVASNRLEVELDLARADLARAAASLAGSASRFPQRGDDPTL